MNNESSSFYSSPPPPRPSYRRRDDEGEGRGGFFSFSANQIRQQEEFERQRREQGRERERRRRGHEEEKREIVEGMYERASHPRHPHPHPSQSTTASPLPSSSSTSSFPPRSSSFSRDHERRHVVASFQGEDTGGAEGRAEQRGPNFSHSSSSFSSCDLPRFRHSHPQSMPSGRAARGGGGEEEEERRGGGGGEQQQGERGSMPNWITALEEELNKKLLVVLRDGRKFIGVLRTFDQFGNLVLEDTYERLIPEKGEIFSDVYAGCIIIRGDNMLLFGDVDETKSVPLRKAPLHEVLALLQQEETEQRQRLEKRAWTDRQPVLDGDDW